MLHVMLQVEISILEFQINDLSRRIFMHLGKCTFYDFFVLRIKIILQNCIFHGQLRNFSLSKTREDEFPPREWKSIKRTQEFLLWI